MTWNGSKQIVACGALARTVLAYAGPGSVETASSASAPPTGRSSKNRSNAAAFFPAVPPHDGGQGVVRDQGQILVVLAPADLVHANLGQALRPARVQLLVGDPLTHGPDGAPGDPGERRHRGLVGPSGQPHHKVLKVGREARTGPGERDPPRSPPHAPDRPTGAAASPAPAGVRPGQDASSASPRHGVVPVPGAERAVRTGQHPTT